MKRSEMVMIVSLAIAKQAIAKGQTNIDLSWIDTNSLLSIIEENGMLPPETKALPNDFTNSGFTQQFLDEHDFYVNKWEPEDE